MFFDLIKFRLPGVKTGKVPCCFHFFFLLNKAGTRISVGEISENHQMQTHSRSLPHTCCITSTIQHAKEQDRRKPRRDDRTFDSTKAPLTSFGSHFFLFQWWYVQLISHKLLKFPKFLSLNEFLLISKTKLNEPWQSTFALHALPWINLHTLYSLTFTLLLWTKTW